MEEVVRTKVLKILDLSIIYSIFDISWVNYVQLVLKKSEVTVIANVDNELILIKVTPGWCT